MTKKLTRDSLLLDCPAAVEQITSSIRHYLANYRRHGLIVALSGGVDSSVTAALCVRAVGATRVLGLHMPERETAVETLPLSRSVSLHFGFESMVEEITPILDASGCYTRQEDYIRMVVPEYGPAWKFKVSLPSVFNKIDSNCFNIMAVAPDGRKIRQRLSRSIFLGIIATTHFKQRVRKMFEYYHADRLNYAVAGTSNRLALDQGFFAKLGDGAADIKPLAHLYKSQVYELADFLRIPEPIRRRAPASDICGHLPEADEYNLSLSCQQVDFCLYGKTQGLAPEEVAVVAGISADQVQRVYANIDAGRAATRYLHATPLLVEEVNGISASPR